MALTAVKDLECYQFDLFLNALVASGTDYSMSSNHTAWRRVLEWLASYGKHFMACVWTTVLISSH
jgi:hypothetical protein